MKDAVVVSPMGQMKVVEGDLDDLRAQKMMSAGHCQMLWPTGLERSLAHVSRLVLLYGQHVPKSDTVRSPGKQPIDNGWPNITLKEREVVNHVLRGGNIGMRAGDGLVILDFHGRFRIALAFPDVGMGQFMRISSLPAAIIETMGGVAGVEKKSSEDAWQQ